MDYLTFISHDSEDTWIAKKLAIDCKNAGADTFVDDA